MRTSFLRGFGCLLFAGLGATAPSPLSEDLSAELAPRERGVAARDLVKRAPTCNTPTNRACWTTGFDINTDYEENFPATGVVRNYNFEITEHDNWVNPKEGGVKLKAMLINGQFPGPNIVADWGDTVRVTVTNKLRVNGTSIHWHGVRMLNNNVNDGANGITECPIPPNSSKVYTFRAEQYGSSWYHSHFSSQYANGIVGTIQFNGPHSLPYDEDLGVFPITDWYYGAADQIQHNLIPPGTFPPPSDNVLFNGSHVNAGGGGQYARVKLKPGKRHLLRIINTSVDNTFQISMVGHQFTVVAADFVPVNAFTAQSLFLAVGQRYDVTIDASQQIGNYWFNVTFSGNGLCGTSNMPRPAAIFQYEGAPTTLPTNPGTPPSDHNCEDNTNLVPIIQRNVPPTSFSATRNNTLDVELDDTRVWEGITRVYWEVNGQDMNITWDEPTLEYLAKGNMNFPARYNVFQVPQSNVWSFWVIDNIGPVPHPMHLHGHDFLILGRSPALANPFPVQRRFNPATDTALLDFTNPTRRDTTMLPGNGWLVVAFRSDNPGAWLFHCHIAWHVSQGLSVQFLERVQDIPQTVPLNAIEPNCQRWTDYYATSPFKQFDSGL
ncbi:laccase [Podospora aff. communis PSN243]|uniref:laccase n=1 Tax=Podospora aff. communis PSN243 TaxID=3040156 RepID=A0AAV9GE47_9PEZI|nr:laccase [Podospora aff. communis PSN243]